MFDSRLCIALAACVFANMGFAQTTFQLRPLGRYSTGVFDQSAAEIAAYDAASKHLFVVNAHAVSADVLDISDPAKPRKIGVLDAKKYGKSANSVAVHGGLVAVAIEASDRMQAGKVAFFQAGDLEPLGDAAVGVLPDMLTFSPDGRWLLVANEGEPSDDYRQDPEGSVTVIDLADGPAKARVRQAGFAQFNNQADALRQSGVRIFGPGASVAQDIEPEYIAVSADSKTAWIALQENNAIAKLDIAKAEITDIWPLGYKDHSLAGNHMDASDKDKAINIQTWPVLGMYQPDSIVAFASGGREYLISANEGDARDYAGFSEEARVADLRLDGAAFENKGELRNEKNLGRLKVTKSLGDANGDGKYEKLYSYGARSFSIWDSANGSLLFDSGDAFERITAEQLGRAGFNADNSEQGFDERSDAKGPEPEGLAVGIIGGRRLLFVGLERVGGIMVYDITEPAAPRFQSYFNDRDYSQLSVRDAGDLGPEGLLFIPAEDSPNGIALLVAANEVSGSTTIYTVQQQK